MCFILHRFWSNQNVKLVRSLAIQTINSGLSVTSKMVFHARKVVVTKTLKCKPEARRQTHDMRWYKDAQLTDLVLVVSILLVSCDQCGFVIGIVMCIYIFFISRWICHQQQVRSDTALRRKHLKLRTKFSLRSTFNSTLTCSAINKLRAITLVRTTYTCSNALGWMHTNIRI